MRGAALIRNPDGKVLIDFSHGLGDAVQFTIVLQHLRERYPNLTIDVLASVGKTSCFAGLANKTFNSRREISDRHDQRIRLDWWECDQTFDNVPSTKASKCLKEVFGIEPTIKPYLIHVPENAKVRVADYLKTLPNRPFVVLHYQGNTATDRKNLEHQTIRRLCGYLISREFTPVILDFDHRSPLPDQRTIYCPDKGHPLWGGTGTGNAAIIAALIERAALFIGIDSGPLHVAQATSTPIVACWTGHHPIHFSDISGDVVHLVPADHTTLIRGDRNKGLSFFQSHYDYWVYGSIEGEWNRLVAEKL
jgi:hypothetical protein